MKPENLFASIPLQLPEELIEPLLQGPGVRIERILSRGHASSPGFWYQQEESEWVLLLRGQARLEFADGVLDLNPGDYLDIPAGVRHRVAWTSRDPAALWLTVFHSGPADAQANPQKIESL